MGRVGILCCGKRWTKGCPGIGSHVLCFEALNQKRGPLGAIPEAEITSFRPCRSCSAVSLVETASRMVAEDKVKVVVLASCLFMNHGCPHVEEAARGISSLGSCQVVLGSFWDPTTPSAAPSIKETNPAAAGEAQQAY
ncbi:MAG: CGGC domain-containing protein [Bacillota bacterium]